MVADPGPGVPIPALTWAYAATAEAFPARAGSPRFSRVSGLHRLQAARGGGYAGNKTLILHWYGRSWTDVPAPSPGDEPEFLGVAATSANSAWAVGLGGGDHTLIVHWVGTTWTRQADRHRS